MGTDLALRRHRHGRQGVGSGDLPCASAAAWHLIGPPARRQGPAKRRAVPLLAPRLSGPSRGLFGEPPGGPDPGWAGLVTAPGPAIQ